MGQELKSDELNNRKIVCDRVLQGKVAGLQMNLAATSLVVLRKSPLA